MTYLVKSTLIAVPVVALAGSFSQAGGLAEPIVAPAPVPVVAPAPAPASPNWTGFYAGGSLGYGTADVDGVTGDFEGVTYGAHLGYNYDLGNIVVGGELEASFGNEFTNDDAGLELDQVLRAKLRAGYDAGAFLPYATAGIAQATVQSDGGTLEDTGAFYGFGLDYAVSDQITVGAEVLRHDLQDFDGGGDVEVDTLSLRASYNF